MARQHGTAEYSARFIFRHFLLFIVVHLYIRISFLETSFHNLCNQITHIHNKLIKHAKKWHSILVIYCAAYLFECILKPARQVRIYKNVLLLNYNHFCKTTLFWAVGCWLKNCHLPYFFFQMIWSVLIDIIIHFILAFAQQLNCWHFLHFSLIHFTFHCSC